MAASAYPKHDPLMDFFDLSKTWQPQTVYAPIPPRVEEGPPPLREEELLFDDTVSTADWTTVTGHATAAGPDDIPGYAKEIRKRVEDEAQLLDLQSTTSRGGVGAAAGAPGARIDSGLSVIDSCTVAGASDMASVAGTPAYQREQNVNLLKGYYMRGRRMVGGKAAASAAAKTKKLVIERERGQIIDAIESNQVTVISGPTGCGKTTQVPQFILSHCEENNTPANIIVTQPRKIAAQSVARRVCNENGWELGTLVGYKVGLDKENVSRDTRLLYCTTGMFKKMIIGKKSLSEWTHIILDEVHEREMDLDFALMLCKQLARTNSRGVKLILMSATMEVSKFEEYFEYPLPNGMKGIPGIVRIPEKENYPIGEYFLNTVATGSSGLLPGSAAVPSDDQQLDFSVDEPELKLNCVKQLYEICCDLPQMDRNIQAQMTKSRNKLNRSLFNVSADESMMTDSTADVPTIGGAVLVFLPGEQEIQKVKNFLEKRATENGKLWWVIPLHSKIPVDELNQAFDSRKGMRKIILATNVAESSITIPDVTYVVDFCLTKKLNSNKETNYVSLQLEWADKDSCKQRRGRCGRVGPGRCIKLVPDWFFNSPDYPAHGVPEMRRAPLDKVLLDTKLLDFGSPKQVLAFAMSPPDGDAIEQNIMMLKEIGALLPTVDGKPVRDDGDLTVLGEILASLPIDNRFGKLVVLGHLLGVLEECVIVAAGISNKSIFATPFGRKVAAYNNKLYWANNQFSDCMATLFAYNTWKKQCSGDQVPNRRDKEQWCNSRHLQLPQLEDMDKTILEIYEGLRRAGIEPKVQPNDPTRAARGLSKLPNTSDEDYNKIKFAIFGAFYPNYFVRTFKDLTPREVMKELNGYDPMTSVAINIKDFPREQSDALPIYEDQIKRWAEEQGIVKDKCQVHFDGRKAIIKFYRGESNANNTTMMMSETGSASFLSEFPNQVEILHEVYVAMKLKSLPREEVRLQVWDDHYVKKTMKRLRDMHQKSESTITSHEQIGQVIPSDNQFNSFKVVYTSSPNSFWVVTPGEDDAIMEVVEQAEDFRKGAFREFKHNELKERIVAFASYEDAWYRARIEKIERGEDRQIQQVTVWFIDFGNTEVITDMKFIRKMDLPLIQKYPKLIATPGQAMECTLTSVGPNPLRKAVRAEGDGGSQAWDDYSIKVFMSLLEESKTHPQDDIIRAEIYSVVPKNDLRLMSLTVYGPDEQTLNAKMLRTVDDNSRRLAFAMQEGLNSQDDHDARKRRYKASSATSSIVRSTAKKDSTFSVTDDMSRLMIEKRKDEKYRWANMQGPFHPLEYNVVGAHRQGASMQARVEPDSVNSILLDRCPNDPFDQWMVAANVSLSQRTDALTLRSTTFMPVAGGLGPLLAMVFAPRVELRCDKSYRNYTGCLIGLGHREKNWGRMASTNNERCPYFAVHDSEIKFDFELTDQDINFINKARHAVSKALIREASGKRGMTPAQKRAEIPANITIDDKLLEIREQLEDALNSLVHIAKRAHKEKVPFYREYHWKGIPDHRFVPLKLAGWQEHILPSVSKINLNGSYDAIVRRLDVLKDWATGPSFTDAMIAAKKPTCPLCIGGGGKDAVAFASKTEIHDHLYKDADHKTNLKAVLAEVKKK